MQKFAVFAGGCFWGMEDLFRHLPGVIETEVGYTGGENVDPTYQNHPGHAEALRISYDDAQTSFRQLLDFFFRIHDPTTRNRQGNDIGTSYRSAIFYGNDEERQQAEAFIDLVNRSLRWSQPVSPRLSRLAHFIRLRSIIKIIYKKIQTAILAIWCVIRLIFRLA